MHKFLMAGAALVVATCVAAIYFAEAGRSDGYQLEFISLSQPDRIGQTLYKCARATDIALCMRSAGKDLCGDDEFELLDDSVYFDNRGTPLMRYRCYRVRRPVI